MKVLSAKLEGFRTTACGHSSSKKKEVLLQKKEKPGNK
jgi:hypothetical protein